VTVVKRSTHGGLNALLGSEHVRRIQQDGKILFAAVDIVAALTSGGSPRSTLPISRRASRPWRVCARKCRSPQVMRAKR
jgi:hypothetical protein